MSESPQHEHEDGATIAPEQSAGPTQADDGVEPIVQSTADQILSSDDLAATATEAVADVAHSMAPEYPPAAPPATVSMPALKVAADVAPAVRAVPAYGMGQLEPDYGLIRAKRFGIAALCILGAMVILYLLQDVLIPFALAFLLAYLIHPVVSMFHQLTGRRGVAMGMTVGVLAVAAVGIATQLLPVMSRQTVDLTLRMNDVWREVQDSIKYKALDRTTIPERGAVSLGKTDVGWREFVSAWGEYLHNRGISQAEAIARLRGAVSGTIIGGYLDNQVLFIQNRPFNDMVNRAGRIVFSSGWGATRFALSLLASAGLALVVVCYLLLLIRDFPNITTAWQSLLPPAARAPVAEFFDEYSQTMAQHFCRQAVAAVIIAVLFSAGFTIVNLPLAVPLGIFIGLLSMVPFLKIAGLAPALALAVFYAVDERTSVMPLVTGTILVFVVVQLISELALKPFVVGRAPGVERLGIVLGMFVLPSILGWLGILLAIPATCAFIAWTRVQSRRYAMEEEYHQLAAA